MKETEKCYQKLYLKKSCLKKSSGLTSVFFHNFNK